ncbi:MAG: alpha/beta fold hydrolase, partial [Chloroflexota bacterium]
FYPRADWAPPPHGASDHAITVGQGVSVGARFYPVGPGAPAVLFFHGNGEVASDYDDIAPLYHQQGIGLFVADYRGYGRSGGSPTFASMVADAHPVFEYFRDLVRKGNEGRLLRQGSGQALFVMGRSLGSHSAIELASSYAGEMRGLILESGFAHVPSLLRHHGLTTTSPQLDAFERAVQARVRSIALPVLVIHGEWDTLVPPEFAHSFYENVGSKDKTLLTIPGAGHNDIMLLGMREYFSAIGDFVTRLGREIPSTNS